MFKRLISFALVMSILLASGADTFSGVASALSGSPKDDPQSGC